MNLHILLDNIVKTAKSNAPELLTGLGVAGVITTSYLSAKAGYESAEVLRGTDVPSDRKERIKTQVHHTWRLYIPSGISGALTIACVIGSARTSGKRTAAAVAAYSLTEKAFGDYREKVVEQIGKNKEQKIRDEVAQEKVSKNPPSKEVIVVSGGNVLCCELYTHRYFRSDMERLRKAMNDINQRIMNQLYVDLDEFYDVVGLPYTSNSSNIGWDSDKLMELRFSSVISEDGEPCLAFEYNYLKPLR